MSRTYVPPAGPVAKGMTPQDILDYVHEELKIAWGDYDKADTIEDNEYYAGLVDAYHFVQSFITDGATKAAILTPFNKGAACGAGAVAVGALAGYALLQRRRRKPTPPFERKGTMLSKTIKFLDLDDNEVEETFYFRYRQSDLMKLHIIHEADGGYGEWLKKVVDSKNGELIIETFEKMVAGCVGQKHSDNRTFLQTPEITAKFMQSDAYSEFFTEIVTDADVAGKFFQAVVPDKLSRVAQAAVDKARAEGDTSVIGEEGLTPKTEPTPLVASTDAPSLRDFGSYSREELLALSDDDFDKVVGTKDPMKMTLPQMQVAMQRRVAAGK